MTSHGLVYILRVPGQTVSTSPKTQGVPNHVGVDLPITSAAYPQTPLGLDMSYDMSPQPLSLS